MHPRNAGLHQLRHPQSDPIGCGARKGTPPLSRQQRVVSHQVPKVHDKKYADEKIDLLDFDEVIEIDPERKICIVEPGVPFCKLVDHTLIEWDGQNTSREVEGIQTLVVADTLSNLRVQVSGLLEDARPVAEKVQTLSFSHLATNPYNQLAMVVHEAFHVFQDKQAPDKGVSEMLLLDYPVLSVQNNVGFAQEGSALAETLRAKGDGAFRRAAVRWLALRKERRLSLPLKALEYEDGIEFIERLAKYTEYRLFQVLEGRCAGPAMSWAQGFVGYADLSQQREGLIEQMVQHMSGAVQVNNEVK